MDPYLEHANITVPEMDAALDFLRVACPTWQIRHDAIHPVSKLRWVHVGTPDSYLALQEPHSGRTPEDHRRPYDDIGINHLGIVVPDFDALAARLDAAGYRRGMEVDPHPARKRAYWFDHAGFEWEFIEYLTSDPADRHDYTR